MSPRNRCTVQGDSPLITMKSNANDKLMSPIHSPISMRAYLGPLSPNEAENVKFEWRKHSPANKILRLTDPDKGLERQGRELARKYRTQLIEFWPFLDAYCDISSEEGLQLFENYLQEREQNNKLKDLSDHLADNTMMGDIEAGFANLKLNSSSPLKKDDSQVHDQKLNSGLMDLIEDSKVIPKIPDSEESDQKTSTPLSNFAIWNQARLQQKPSDNSSILSDNPSLHRSMSSSSTDSFASAVSSLNESVFSAEEGSWNYIKGSQPCQFDEQVYQAIKDCEIDVVKFPRIHTWKCLIESSAPQDRSHWRKHKGESCRKVLKIPQMSFDD